MNPALIEVIPLNLSDTFGEGCEYTSYQSESDILKFITSQSQASGQTEMTVAHAMSQDTEVPEKKKEEQPSCYTELLSMQNAPQQLNNSHFKASLPLESAAPKERMIQPDTLYWGNSQRFNFTDSCVLERTFSAPQPQFEAVCHREGTLEAEIFKRPTNHACISTEPYKSSAEYTAVPAKGFWPHNSHGTEAAQVATPNPLAYQNQFGQLTDVSLTGDQFPLQQTGCIEPSPAVRKTVEHRVKKPQNAFMIFRKSFGTTSRLQSERTAEMDISKKAGMAWRALTAEEKHPYILQQQHLARLHKIEHPDYKYHPQRKAKTHKK